jgi:Leucine-rich repeat (LRR) protein
MWMDGKFSLETLSREASLDLRCIDQKGWETILASCNASDLRLYYLKIRSLAGVERLRHTTRLSIEWANKIEDISPLFAMQWLATLTLYDLPRIRTLDGIAALEGLKELNLSGCRGSLNPPLRLDSVRPIAGLRNLEKLEITNIRLEERDISFVASAFPDLRSLRLSGKEFEREHLAYLAKRLNPQLEEPLVSSWETTFAVCKCGKPLHLFMGRKMRMLCAFCDAKRFEKLTEEFHQSP